MIEYLIRKGD